MFNLFLRKIELAAISSYLYRTGGWRGGGGIYGSAERNANDSHTFARVKVYAVAKKKKKEENARALPEKALGNTHTEG